MLLLQFFKAYLFSRHSTSLIRTISILSIVGVTVGVLALVVVTAVMNGFHASIRKNLLSSEPHLVIEINGRENDPTALDQALADISSAHPEFEFKSQVLVLKQDFVLRTAEGVFSGVEARGLPTRALIDRVAMMEGLSGPAADLEFGGQDVVLGYDLASNLSLYEGDRLTLLLPESLVTGGVEAPRFEKVSVKRLLSTQVQDVDGRLFLYDREKSLLSLKAARSARWQIEVDLKDASNANEVKEKLNPILVSHELWTAADYTIATWETRNSSLFQALRLELFAIGAFLVLSTLIAGFSIVTVLAILLSQKQKEIGLLMAIGMSQQQTKLLFTGIGGALGSIGSVLGVVLGLLICWVIESNPAHILPDFYYDTSIPAHPNAIVVLGVLFGGIGLSLFASYLGANRATQLSPAEALTSRRRSP